MRAFRRCAPVVGHWVGHPSAKRRPCGTGSRRSAHLTHHEVRLQAEQLDAGLGDLEAYRLAVMPGVASWQPPHRGEPRCRAAVVPAVRRGGCPAAGLG